MKNMNLTTIAAGGPGGPGADSEVPMADGTPGASCPTDSVPLESLAMPDDSEQMTPPEVGDEVNYQVTGKVVSIEGGVAQVQKTSINGQPVADTDGDQDADSPDNDEDAQGLRTEAGGMSGLQ